MVRTTTLRAALLLGAYPVALLSLTAQAHAQAQAEAQNQAQTPNAGEQAQEAADGNDIVVTAQRREQRLQDVPVAATVVTGDSVARQGIRDLQDLSTRLPDVKLSTNTQSDIITIRGIGSGLSAGFEQAVGTFVDGAYRGRSRSTRAALFDIERIEVLKGPQTTFFGNNTIAGALNITTRKPGDRFEYNATALYAPTDGEYIGEAGVSVPLGDTLAVRGAFKASGMNGYTYNRGTREDAPHLRDWIGRVSARWEPTSDFRSDLRFDRVRNRDRGQYTLEVVDCPPSAPFVATGGCALALAANGGAIDNRLDFKADMGPSWFRLDQAEGAWTNSLSLGEYNLSALTTYYEHDIDLFLNAQAVSIPGTGGTASRTPFRQLENYENFSQELRFQSPSGGFFEYMVGAYFSYGKLRTRAYTGNYGSTVGALGAPLTNAASPIVASRDFRQRDWTRSAFASATIRPVDAFRINLGLRYTSVLKKATRLVEIGVGDSVPGPDMRVIPEANAAVLANALGHGFGPFAEPRDTYSKLMPTGSIQYDFSPNITGYASYTKGFLAGGYTDTPRAAQFGSEGVDAYEIGLKGSLLDRKLSFAFDVFQSKYDDLQVAVSFVSPLPPFAPITTVANAASARSRGAEFNASLRAAPWLTINTDVAYVKATYLSYPGTTCSSFQLATIGATCTQDLSGRRRELAPTFTGTLNANLNLPIGDRNALTIVPSLYHSSSYFLQATLDPLLTQKAYQKVDLRLGFGPRDESWEIAVIGKNLTRTKSSSYATPMPSSNGVSQFLLDRDRSIAVSLSIKG